MQILVVLFLFPLILSGQKKEIPKVVPLEIGAVMPNFLLKGVDNKMYSQNDFKKHDILVVIFTCNHCPTAQAYENRVNELYSEFKNKGVGFVAISPNSNEALSLAECGYSDLDDSFEAMQIRAKDIKLEFPYLFDGETSETSMKFGPIATPHVFIFDTERKLRYRGRIDDMESPYETPNSFDTHNALIAMVNGDVVPVEVTKTFGCSVKWPWKDEWTKQLIKSWSEEEVVLKDASKESLSEMMKNNGKNLLLVNVWATYCGPCIMEFSDLVETFRMYQGRGLDFATVSMDRPVSKEKVLKLLNEKQASGMNYFWNGGTSYDAIEIIDPEWQGSLPYTLLVKPGGEVIYKHEGPVNTLLLRKAIIGEFGRYFADDM